ncbi:hypothetical protein BJX76DRAFT_252699 [Aspergillus varians]
MYLDFPTCSRSGSFVLIRAFFSIHSFTLPFSTRPPCVYSTGPPGPVYTLSLLSLVIEESVLYICFVYHSLNPSVQSLFLLFATLYQVRSSAPNASKHQHLYPTPSVVNTDPEGGKGSKMIQEISKLEPHGEGNIAPF